MIDKFEMLIALAREKHFGRAAEACHVTQPTLSSAIRSLEDLYGVPLVHRGGRFQGLTVEGEQVLVRARLIVAEARAIRSDLQGMKAGVSGTLRLGVIPTALAAVGQLTAPFGCRHPGARFIVRSMSAQDIADGLADLQIDAGLSYRGDDPGRGAAPDFIPLWHEAHAVLVSDRAGISRMRWQDMGTMRLCLLTRDMQHRRRLDAQLAARGLDPLPVLEASSILALVAHVRSDPGSATILPSHLAEFFAGHDGLRCLGLQDDGVPVLPPEVGLILPPEGRRSLLLDAFVRELPRGPGGAAG